MTDRINDEITKVAYDLYEKGGSKEGNDLLNWLAAEKIVHFRQMIIPAVSGESFPLLDYKPMISEKSGTPPSGKRRVRPRRLSKTF